MTGPKPEPTVTNRASMLPIGNYSDGSVGFAWPQGLVDVYEAMKRFHNNEPPQPQDAVLAGLAMAGTGFGGIAGRSARTGSVAGAERAAASSALPSSPVEAGSRFARSRDAAAKRAVEEAPDATWYHGTTLPKDAPLIVPDDYYGVHMTRSKELGRSYGDERGNLRAYDDGFQNPFTMPPFGSPEYAAALAKAKEMLPGFDGTKASLEANAAGYSKILRERGYDSIVSQDETLLDDALEGIAFRPNDMYRLFSNAPDAAPVGVLAMEAASQQQPDYMTELLRRAGFLR
jgi:hypothetical protein